jgi:glycosyltransferase involved in cell wall biosynthesis
MELSIVIPVYNEEENVEPLIQEINAAVRPLGKPYEIVVVDDGSRDATLSVLTRLHLQDSSLRVVRLKRNFGQTAAIAAGLAHSDGDVVILMDGDAQNDPKDIPALLAELKKGNDLVCGWRSNRRDPFFNRRLPSMIANHLVSLTTRVKLHDYGCTLKAMRRDVAKNLKLYGECIVSFRPSPTNAAPGSPSSK